LLTDFTPDIICIAFQNKYAHRLQKLFEFMKEDGKIVRKLDIKRLEEILNDVEDYSDKIFFGMISGIIENEEEVKKTLQKFRIEVKTPKEVIEEALKFIENSNL
ncbi:type I-B CRISPR-associated protein Cas7/Cst2/DevR, partial [bacterium]